MSISFIGIPLDIRTPGVFGEIDPSKALQSSPAQSQRVILFGQKLAAGTQPANVPFRLLSGAQADVAAGSGAVAAELGRTFKNGNRTMECWMVLQDDLTGGTKATGTLVIAGTATGNGTLALLIGGFQVQVGVPIGQTPTQTGDAIVAAMALIPRLPVTAINTAGSVALTAKHKGTLGNKIDLRYNYYQGEVLPAGVTVTVTAMSGGAGDPDVTDSLDALGDVWYNFGTHPYVDAANLTRIETEGWRRFGPLVQQDITFLTSAKDTHGNLTTLGNSRNSAFNSILGAPSNPTSPWVRAGAYGAAISFYGANDPARPFQTLPLVDCLPPAIEDRFNRELRDLLLHDGIATCITDDGGVERIERAITTYQVNELSEPDPVYLDVNTLLQISRWRFKVRQRIKTRFPRHKLADDTAKVSPGQAVVQPKLIKYELIALFREEEAAGQVENIEQFIEDLIVERASYDVNRVDAQDSPDFINQFIVMAIKHQFRLAGLAA